MLANLLRKGEGSESFAFDNMPSVEDEGQRSEEEGDQGHHNGIRRRKKSTVSDEDRISAEALSMSFMKAWSGVCCDLDDCEKHPDPIFPSSSSSSSSKKHSNGERISQSSNRGQLARSRKNGVDRKNFEFDDTPSEVYNLRALHQQASSNSISPLVAAPMMLSTKRQPPSSANGDPTESNEMSTSTSTVEGLIGEYMYLCKFYNVSYNAGIMTTLRFSMPSLRVAGSFHDLDMLVLVELLLRHANHRLSFIRRLDFSLASKEGRQNPSYKLGFTSHGALALAKVLQKSKYIQQVWLPRHRIGPYGASALFLACRDNPTIQTLNLRRCRIGERGAFAFCELIANNALPPPSPSSAIAPMNSDRSAPLFSHTFLDAVAGTPTGLLEVDLSSNGIGHRGTAAIERALKQRHREAPEILLVNLEGNLVFPEIMNGVTHGVGVILCCIGGYLLSDKVKDQTLTHRISCGVYTTSLVALYLSSTLFHSFFALQNIKYIFQVMDKCAIYVLIAGNYTPFLTILLGDQPLYSVGLLGFIWACCFLGIGVEAFYPTWNFRPVFSLTMYLGMGWACVVCLPHCTTRIAQEGMNLLILGGVGYTAGVPFFVRNNNLDHAIWHLFVLSGSIFHWLTIFLYVAPCPLRTISEVE